MNNNKLIIAAAGSGKTSHLIEEAIKNREKKVLITTYTQANEAEIKKKIIEQDYNTTASVYHEIKRWINTLDQEEIYVLKAQNGGEIKKETEKAYQLKFTGKYGTIIKWIPKSACEN